MTLPDYGHFSDSPIPVVVFIFNRPEFALRQASFILDLEPRKVFVVSDGWRSSTEKALVLESRSSFEVLTKKHQVEWIFSNENLGLELRFFSALDEVAIAVDRFVVIEDDCRVAESFITLAERVTDAFGHDSRFGIASAHNPAPFRDRNRLRIVASTFPRIWGWATVSRVWKDFRKMEAKRTASTLSINQRVPLTSRIMFLDLWRRRKQIGSWDVAFVGYLLESGLANISASGNLVNNLGLSGIGTNSHLFGKAENPSMTKLLETAPLPSKLPVKPSLYAVAREDALRLLMWVQIVIRSPRTLFRKLAELLNRS